MSLNKFIKTEDTDKDKVLEKLIKNIRKDKKLSKEIAIHKAEEIVFKPVHLEKIKLNSMTNVGLRPSLTIFFNNIEELKTLGKFVNVNWNRMEVGNADFLIKLLGGL